MSATERQLAVRDCTAGDEAACAALVASPPHYNGAHTARETFAGQAARYYLVARNNEVAMGCANLGHLYEISKPDEPDAYLQQACDTEARYRQ